MKHCKACGQDLPLDAFGKHAKSPDGLYFKCKVCRRAYDAEHYKNNPARRAKIREVDVHNRQVNMAKLNEIKSSSKCVDCGNDNPIVLDFDHLGDKEHNISDMIRHGRSWASIEREIAKCEVVCSNCHRIRTHNRRIGCEV